MRIRQNIFISIMIHTMVIASVFIVSGRGRYTACRVPANHIAVSLFREVTGVAFMTPNMSSPQLLLRKERFKDEERVLTMVYWQMKELKWYGVDMTKEARAILAREPLNPAPFVKTRGFLWSRYSDAPLPPRSEKWGFMGGGVRVNINLLFRKLSRDFTKYGIRNLSFRT